MFPNIYIYIDLVKSLYSDLCYDDILIHVNKSKGFYSYQGPEVRSGDLPQPVILVPGQEFTFTIKRGVGTTDCVSVNYDDFVNDVDAGDMLLVDGKL